MILRGDGGAVRPEVVEPKLPRKASSEIRVPVPHNRHRWAGRIYRGDRENPR